MDLIIGGLIFIAALGLGVAIWERRKGKTWDDARTRESSSETDRDIIRARSDHF